MELSHLKMKRHILILSGGLLALSLTLNVFLGMRLASLNAELSSARANANEMGELRRQNEELRAIPTNGPVVAGADAQELARLRIEAGQRRIQAGEAAASRAQAAAAEQLRLQLAKAMRDLALAEDTLAEVSKLSPDELQQMKEEAHSVVCVNNLKQIGLAAWRWAKNHENVFPPDFATMQDELTSPKILFCPAGPAAPPVTEWSQLNPSLISYRMNPNGVSDPAAPLATCSIHNHRLLVDGSVHRQ